MFLMLLRNFTPITSLQRSFLRSRNGIWRCSSKLIEASRYGLEGSTQSIGRAPAGDFHTHSTTLCSKMMSNVEIKARLADPARLARLRAFAEKVADGMDVMKQVDTFFNCKNGRLKLREIVNHRYRHSTGELIAYIRPDQDGPKQSKYTITEVDDPESLKETLGMALGVRGVVKKTRTLLLIGQTRLHIDEVEGLGNFMELEVVLEEYQTQEEGQKIAQDLMKQFSIDQSDLVSGAYIDLLES